jgi:hypothetical protein
MQVNHYIFKKLFAFATASNNIGVDCFKNFREWIDQLVFKAIFLKL